MKRKFNILLIDDNPIDVMVLKKTFSNINADCSITEFMDAEMAFIYLENIKKDNSNPLPDLIICDLVLPMMSGNELLSSLKKDSTLKSIPFVMFTNSSAENDVKQAYSHNVNSYIVKPLSLNIYKQTIRCLWDFWSSAVRLPDQTVMMKSIA